MKRSIKVKMVDYNFSGYKPGKELVYQILTRLYDVDFCDDPDYIISGGYGDEHLKYDCIKLLNNSENCVSDLNFFDYAIGHDYMTFGDRYIRMPHFAAYPEYKKLDAPFELDDASLLNRDFCSFIVSNAKGDPLRDQFFHKLSKYKPIASGGRHLNNIGMPVVDKLDFCSKYKFNIAFENSVVPGYVTEKVMQPLSVGSIPIYYGDPLIGNDFNEQALVVVKNEDDVDRAMEEIIYLDSHDDAYLAKCRSPRLINPVNIYEDRYADFLRHIIDQPIEQARRLSRYGNQAQKRDRLRWLLNLELKTRGARVILSKFRKFFV